MFTKLIKASLFRQVNVRNMYYFSPKQPFFSPNINKQQKQYQQKRSSYLNIAMSCFVFALCFAGIPIYRTFCEHMGLVGDNNKKQYNFDGAKINNMKKYKVKFTGYSDPDVNWEFEPIEKEVNISAGQTAIIFYRLYNKQERPIVGFASYNISPEDCNTYFSKIQCFCFNQQLINPKEELLLPIFFYLQPQINEDISVSRISQMSLTYNFTKSAKQNLAKFAQDELKRVQENKRKLNEIRAKKMNLNIDQYIKHLQEQQESERMQNQLLKQKSLQKQQDDYQKQQKLRQHFEQQMLKAQLISREFETDNVYSRTYKTAQTVV